MGFFDKLKEGLAKTRAKFTDTLNEVFSNAGEIDEDFYDELEETLILADLGVETATKATERLRKAIREQKLKTPEEAKAALKEAGFAQADKLDRAELIAATQAAIWTIANPDSGDTYRYTPKEICEYIESKLQYEQEHVPG